MRRAAGQVDHDDGLVRLAEAGLRLGLEQLRQSQPAKTERADLEKITTRKTVAEAAVA